MSEFRRFCIGALVLPSILYLPFMGDWGGDAGVSGSVAAMLAALATMAVGGALAVAMFGKRGS